MWDLQQIVSQSNFVAVEAMMAGERVIAAENPLPEVWPLAWLERRLKVGPPILSEIVNGYIDIEYLENFLNLIRDYLPDYEGDILSKPRNQRVLRFCYLFDKRYFPLGVSNPEYDVHSLLYRLPVQLLGMSYDVYHDIDMRPGYILLLSLIPYPYPGDERDQEDDSIPFNPLAPMSTPVKNAKWKPRKSDIDWLRNLVSSLTDGGTWMAPMGFEITKIDNYHLELKQALNTNEVKDTIQRTVYIAESLGITISIKSGHTAEEKIESGARVALLEKSAELVGMGLIKRIPLNGWDNKQLHHMTDDSLYAGVGEFSDWALSDTGLVLLDTNYGNCEYQEGEMEPVFEWTRANVELLAKQWPKVKKVRKKIDHIVEWLEKSPENRFSELLDFLLEKAEELPNKNTTYSYDEFAHMCPLQMKGDEDEEDENIGL